MTVLFSSIIYIYAASSPATVLLLTAFGGVYTFVLFLCLDFLQKLNKPPIAAAGVVGLLILSLFIGYLCIDSYPDMLYQWFFEPDKMNRIYVGNIFALIFMCGFVLGSALYYFTRIRYRPVLHSTKAPYKPKSRRHSRFLSNAHQFLQSRHHCRAVLFLSGHI